MGVDTKGYINNQITAIDVQFALYETLGIKSRLEDTHMHNYHVLSFEYKGEKRNLNVFENTFDDENEYVESEYTYLSLGKWGHGTEIIYALVCHFGGCYLENDCKPDPIYI